MNILGKLAQNLYLEHLLGLFCIHFLIFKKYKKSSFSSKIEIVKIYSGHKKLDKKDRDAAYKTLSFNFTLLITTS